MSTFIETLERIFGITAKFVGLAVIILLLFLSASNIGNWIWKQMGSPVEYELLSMILIGTLVVVCGFFVAFHLLHARSYKIKLQDQNQRIQQLETTGRLLTPNSVVSISQDSSGFQNLKDTVERVIFAKYMKFYEDLTIFANIGRPTHYGIDLKQATLNTHDRHLLGTIVAAKVKQICDHEKISLNRVRILTHQEGNVLLGSCVSELLGLPHHHYYDSGTSFKGQDIIDPQIHPVSPEKSLTFILVHDVSWGLGRSLKAVQRCLRPGGVDRVIVCVLVNRHENPDVALRAALRDRYNQCKFYYIFNVPRETDLEKMLKKYQS